MSNLLDDIQLKAAALSAEERAALALRLIESLDADYPPRPDERTTPNDPRTTNDELPATSNEPRATSDWESTWLAECERRVARYESGEDRGVPLDQALIHARQRLR